jgi:RHS repeat-associated protein
VADVNGGICDHNQWDAFGLIFSDPSPQNYSWGGAWGYMEERPGSGLVQMGARWYWPELGRFIEQDPEGDGVNWYAYADNNPISYIDPVGGFPQLVAPLLAGAGGGAFVEGEEAAVFFGPPGWIVGGVAAIGVGAYLLTRPAAPLAGPTICPAKGSNPGSGYGGQNDPRGKPRYKGPPRSNKPDCAYPVGSPLYTMQYSSPRR